MSYVRLYNFESYFIFGQHSAFILFIYTTMGRIQCNSSKLSIHLKMLGYSSNMNVFFQDVGLWLEEINLGGYRQVFEENGVNGEYLESLSMFTTEQILRFIRRCHMKWGDFITLCKELRRIKGLYNSVSFLPFHIKQYITSCFSTITTLSLSVPLDFITIYKPAILIICLEFLVTHGQQFDLTLPKYMCPYIWSRIDILTCCHQTSKTLAIMPHKVHRLIMWNGESTVALFRKKNSLAFVYEAVSTP